MFLETTVALRQFRAKRSKTLKFVSWLALVGIALGVLALIGGIAFTGGFEKAFEDKLTGLTAHIMVREYGLSFDGYENIEAQLNRLPEVVGVSPVTHNFALAVGRNQSAGVMVRGIVPQKAAQTLNLEAWMRKGALNELVPETQKGVIPVIIGTGLSRRLGVGFGEQFSMVAMTSLGGSLGSQTSGESLRQKTFVVAGVFEAGFGEFDSKVVYLHLDAARVFFDLGHAVNAFEVRIKNALRAGFTADRIRGFARQDSETLQVLDWRQMNRNIFASLAYQKLAIVLVMLVMVFLAACNAACLLMMMVNERVRETAILRTFGLSTSSVLIIFLIQSLGIGGGGTILGLIIAGGLLAVIPSKGVPVDPDVYAVDSIPLVITSEEMVYVGIASILVTVFASLLPALRAAALKPVDGLREQNQ